MQQTFSSLMRDGYHYMNTWPTAKELNIHFAEGRVIAATRLGIKAMPILAVVSCALMLQVNGSGYLPQALAVAGFFITLPLQGLLWLGHRSNQILPPGLRHWYKEIHAKLEAQGCSIQAAKLRPRYKELAELLKTAFRELDRIFFGKLL